MTEIDLRDLLRLRNTDEEDWRERALCAQTDPESFFPEKGQPSRDAKRMCARCPVRDACLEWALEHNERFGIWGGLTERELRAERRRRGMTQNGRPRRAAA